MDRGSFPFHIDPILPFILEAETRGMLRRESCLRTQAQCFHTDGKSSRILWLRL